MASLLNLSDIINRVTGGNGGNPENLFVFKDPRIAEAAPNATVAGRMTSLWQYNGCPAGGVIPTTPENPTNTTDGSLLQNNPASGKEKWLLGMTGSSLNAGTLSMYDRLGHVGGLSGVSVAVQPVNLGITRNASGVGNLIQVEIYVTIGSTARRITVNYINEKGIPSSTPSTVIGGTGFREAQRIITIPLQAGDRGVRSIESIQLSGSTATTGNFGINIVNPIAVMPLSIAGVGSVRDFISGLPSIPRIERDACLFFGWLASTTTAPEIYATLHLIES